MRWLSDETVDHLRRVADWPDLSATKYRVIQPIADGGMGTVYLARDGELDREVAIKVLKDAVFDVRATERMRREARIVARLEHPGVVPLHDLGLLPDGRTYYVMKLVRGRRLDEHAGDLRTINDRLRVFGRLCDAVAFAHAHGVIHRDVKPQNVMIGEFGEVLLLDWGVAKVLENGQAGESPNRIEAVELGDETAGPTDAIGTEGIDVGSMNDAGRTVTLLTANGTVVGTPAFMAPEQARGQLDRVDRRCDVFALGAVLYWLLTGRTPLDRDAFQRMARGQGFEIAAPRRLNREVTRPLSAICMKALAVDAGDRYADAGALGADLTRYMNGMPVEAYRAGVLERTWRLVVRHRIAVLLIVTYLAVRTLLIFFGRR
ncbi:MAG: serine/threonine protein kinase [Phycisphaerales bacterium]|nr:serine/threonine protein kinase [Phycisphaerales bacterium]